MYHQNMEMKTFLRDPKLLSWCRPQPYRSLKEAESADGAEPGFGAESHTAPPSPGNEKKFSNVNLLGAMFGCQDEPDGPPAPLAKSLEDLRTPKGPEDRHAKFSYQRMDLSGAEHSRTLPGLKLPDPSNPPRSAGPPPARPPAPTEAHELSGPAPDAPDPSGYITIPRPHGRKTPELGAVLAPPAAAAAQRGAAGTPGGQEFRHALSMTTEGDLLTPIRTAVEEEGGGLDLMSLLDPLSVALGGVALGGVALSGAAPSCKPTLPPRCFPQGPPPLPLPPHLSLNPFAPPLVRYSHTVGGNPFGAAYGPPPGSYSPATAPQSFSTPPGLYRQHSPGYGLLQPASFPSSSSSSVAPPPHFSASNHALSSLADANASAKPLRAEGDRRKTQDLFGDLLTLAKPATPPKKKADDLRRRWETFD